MRKPDQIVSRKSYRNEDGSIRIVIYHKCRKPNCKGIVNHKACHSPYCARHRTRNWKEAHPLHYSFAKLRTRAKERGIAFTLTRDEYIAFAVKTDYAKLKGKSGLSLSIDRFDGNRGYERDNIRAITLSQNSRREHVPYFARQIHGSDFIPENEDLLKIQQEIAESYEN